MQIKNTDDTNLDYLDLAPEVVEKVKKHTAKIRGLLKSASENIIETGLELIEAKESVGHGKFEQWLDSQFGLGERTARKMMAVGRQFKTAQYADLQLAPSALYLLAAPSTPDAVREKFVEQAKSTPVAHKEVKAAIDTAKKTKRAKTKKKSAKPAKKKDSEPTPKVDSSFKAPKKLPKIRGKKLFTSVCHAVGSAHRRLYGKQLDWGAHANYRMGEVLDLFIDSKKSELLAEFKGVVALLREKIDEGAIDGRLEPDTLFRQWGNLSRHIKAEETKRLVENVKKRSEYYDEL